jgi:hypothetical protein
MIGATLGSLVGGIICFIGIIFEEWSSKLPGAASLAIIYSGILIRLILGVSTSIGIIVLLEDVNAKWYLISFSIMICIIHPVVIYLKQKRK